MRFKDAVKRALHYARHPGEWSAARYRARSFMAFSAVWPSRWRTAPPGDAR